MGHSWRSTPPCQGRCISVARTARCATLNVIPRRSFKKIIIKKVEAMNPVYGIGRSRVLSCFSRCRVRDATRTKTTSCQRPSVCDECDRSWNDDALTISPPKEWTRTGQWRTYNSSMEEATANGLRVAAADPGKPTGARLGMLAKQKF